MNGRYRTCSIMITEKVVGCLVPLRALVEIQVLFTDLLLLDPGLFSGGFLIIIAHARLEKLSSKVFSLLSKPNNEAKSGRFCSGELGVVAGVRIGGCYNWMKRGFNVGGQLDGAKKDGSAMAVTGISI
ncbi:hypothetical protein Tco_0583649 [Tanacetum coccineum]